LAERKYAECSPPSPSSLSALAIGSQPRLSSPVGGSTLSTSAPASASIIVQ
jgi:hypothetical protein